MRDAMSFRSQFNHWFFVGVPGIIAVTIDLRDIADVQMRLSDKLHKIPTVRPFPSSSLCSWTEAIEQGRSVPGTCI